MTRHQSFAGSAGGGGPAGSPGAHHHHTKNNHTNSLVVPPNVERGMLAAGIDIIPGGDRKNVAAKRAKKGECPTCGIQTHKVALFGKNKPLTVEGQVLKGRCLNCFPLEGYIRRKAPPPQPVIAGQPPQPPQHHLPSQLVPPAASIYQQQQPQHPQYLPQNQFSQQQQHPPMTSPGAHQFTAPLSADVHRQDEQQRHPGGGVPLTQSLHPHEMTRSNLQESQQHYHHQQQQQQDHTPQLYDQHEPQQVQYEQQRYQQEQQPYQTVQQQQPSQPYMSQQAALPPRIPPTQQQLQPQGLPPMRGLPASSGTSETPLIIPRTLDVAGDDFSVVSGITMDMRLIQGARNWDANAVDDGDDDDDDDDDSDTDPLPVTRSRARGSAASSFSARRGGRPDGEDPYAESRPDDVRPVRTMPTYEESLRNLQHQSGSQRGNMLGSTPEHPPQQYPSDDRWNERGLSGGQQQRQQQQIIDHSTSFPEEGGSSSSAHHKRATTRSSFGLPAPPLVERTLRGRPDDDVIQDPMTILQGGGGGGGAGLMPGEHEETSTSHSARLAARGTTARVTPPSSVGHDGFSRQPMFDNAMEDRRWNETSIGHQAYGKATSVARSQSSENYKDNNSVERISPTSNAASMSQEAVPNISAKSTNSNHQRGVVKEPTIRDIPVLIHSLNLDGTNSSIRESRLLALTKIIWKNGDKARDFIIQNHGVDCLVKVMWAHMYDDRLQEAAVEFLYALAVSTDCKASTDFLSNEELFCDSLLFSMQTHSHIQNIQLKGCCIWSCLASASSNNKKIVDGTLSGAVTMVLNAMGAHHAAKEIQKAGMQALFFQCTLSSNAESNKRTLVESKLDDGRNGMEVVAIAIDQLREDPVASSWVCKLLWSLTSSEDLIKLLSEKSTILSCVIQTCLQYMASAEDEEAVVEACLGVVGNLGYIGSNLPHLENQCLADAVTRGMKCHQNHYGVTIEGCSAIANLCSSVQLRDELVVAKSASIVLNVMQDFGNDVDMICEAQRALLGMTIGSDETKKEFGTMEMIQFMENLLVKFENTPNGTLVKENVIAWVASLTCEKKHADTIVGERGFPMIIDTLNNAESEKARGFAAVAVRNLSCLLHDRDILMKQGAIKALLSTMQQHEKCASVQLNACGTLWNMTAYTKKDPSSVVGAVGVKIIVQAMQNHMENGDLLEVACGTLWSLIDDSIDQKKEVVGNGAIDVVTCAVVMHPSTTSTLETAFGVLSNLSTEGPFAEAISHAQGVSIVSEAIRSNPSPASLLEVGCIVLRNIAYQFPEYAQDASIAISSVIHAMQDNMDDTSFQEEACNLLWVLAAEAESCQAKILAMDGIALLMKCLEHHSDAPQIQEAALGAFNQLAVTSR